MSKRERLLTRAAVVANITLAGAGVISLLALCYFAYHYGWSGRRQSTNPAALAIYYVLPSIFTILFFASLRLQLTSKMALAVGCLSLAAAAYGAELFLQLSDVTPDAPKKPLVARPAKEIEEAAVKFTEQYGMAIDLRDRHEVVADLRKQGIQAVVQVSLPLLEKQGNDGVKSAIQIQGNEIMPLGGIANTLTVACNQNGRPLTYETDEHGFHNPKGIWRSRRVDIVAVGNSFTLGYCVPPDKNFVALIRARYSAILNLGMPGQGPLQLLATLKEYAAVYKPKLVLWFYSEANSLPELQNEKRSRILMRYLKDDFTQGLHARQSDLAKALMDKSVSQSSPERSRPSRREENNGKIVDQLPEFIKLSNLRRKSGVVYGEAPREPDGLSKSELLELEADLNLLRNILSEAKARVEAWGGKLYLVYLPCWERYAPLSVVGVKARTQTLSLVSTLGIPVIDAYVTFQAHRDPLSLFPFRGPGHYNQEGHRIVAETVLNVISHRHPNDFQPETQTV